MSAIRRATAADAAACAAIYAPYVRDTVVTFELDPPSAEQFVDRIAAAHVWLVLDVDGVVGYAYGGRWKDRAAYRWVCEVSIYLETGRRRRGEGRALYETLLAALAERGYRIAIAGMTLPNDASVGLHGALGFESVGVNRRIGWKHGAWHDVQWMQRELVPSTDDEPPEPRAVS